MTYSDGYKKTVWLIDGNFEFFKNSSLSGDTCLCPVLLTLHSYSIYNSVYILIFTTIIIMMFWVQKLKPLFDAYTGPYRDNHHYWTGLLLIAHIVFFLFFFFSL